MKKITEDRIEAKGEEWIDTGFEEYFGRVAFRESSVQLSIYETNPSGGSRGKSVTRTQTHIDTPLYVCDHELAKALQTLRPQIGDLHRFERLPDRQGTPFVQRFEVERIDKPEDDQDRAA